VAPSADLVAWTRLGSAYQPAHLQQALERDRALFEYRAMVRPMADLGLYLAEMAAWPAEGRRHAWLEANESFRRYVLDLLRDRGPLLSRDVPDRCEVPWPSTGWTNNRNVTQMLESLAVRGQIAVSGRSSRQRLWDLAERVYPAGTPVVPAAEALRRRVEGTPGVWRVDPAALGRPFTGRTALLSPFDRLVYDRQRALEIFDFEYRLEMYVPKAKRRWGYFALPVLHHDQLIGKVDAAADHKKSVLQVHAIHQDIRFTRAVTAAVHAELEALASWLGLAATTWAVNQ